MEERSLKLVYERYMSIIALKKEIIRLKNDRDITFSKLPPKVQEYFIELVKKEYEYRHHPIFE
jgi:hypothetical protein